MLKRNKPINYLRKAIKWFGEILSFSLLHVHNPQGWSCSEAADMNYFYRELVPPAEHHRVESLEPFDEYEEWHLKCNHYMVVVASNTSGFPSLLSGK